MNSTRTKSFEDLCDGNGAKFCGYIVAHSSIYFNYIKRIDNFSKTLFHCLVVDFYGYFTRKDDGIIAYC